VVLPRVNVQGRRHPFLFWLLAKAFSLRVEFFSYEVAFSYLTILKIKET
jgi:hypothetical protein